MRFVFRVFGACVIVRKASCALAYSHAPNTTTRTSCLRVRWLWVSTAECKYFPSCVHARVYVYLIVFCTRACTCVCTCVFNLCVNICFRGAIEIEGLGVWVVDMQAKGGKFECCD